jgi:hypothetical protein
MVSLVRPVPSLLAGLASTSAMVGLTTRRKQRDCHKFFQLAELFVC